MTVAPGQQGHTTGRGQMSGAVRKAEARPPAPDPVPQVAAISGVGIDRPRGPDATGRLQPTRNAEGRGTDLGARRGWSSFALAQGLTNRHGQDL